MRISSLFLVPLLLVGACGGSPKGEGAVAAPGASSSVASISSAQATPPPPKKPVDAATVERITGAKPEVNGDVVKVSFARNDVPVEVDGVQKFPPFMGLTSWAAFVPGEKQPAMVMGDVVLFEDEVTDAMRAALDNGLEVTALHNHFFFDKPHVYFMHIGGEGTPDALAKGVRAVFDAERAVRKKSAQPASSFAMPALKSPSKIDAAKLDVIFGMKGASKDGMYKATMGRKTRAECGCTVDKKMGVNTWAAFMGTDDAALVDGDFAVLEGELQPVLKSLLGSGIHVVAIHSHMTGEEPRILFLHYWGRGPAADLAKAVKKAVDLTAWDGRSQST